MIITNSPDITNLLVQVTWDLSSTQPKINLENLSTGSGLDNVDWAFVAISPTGTYIHEGNINQPDIEGNWSEYVLTDAFPKPMNQIEWSGLPYQFYVIAKDSNGNVYQTTPQLASICRPFGNTQYSKNTFGLASSDVSVKCQQGRVFFQDNTYHNYKGLEGTQISSTLSVQYPIDETMVIPAPFIIGSYSTALVPISYSSPNYQFLQNEVYDYEIGYYTLVRIKYQLLKTFAVWCNVDLMPLQCEINKLIYQVETGNCSDVVSAQKKLGLITSKFCLVIMGIAQPLTGIDVPKLIDEIITIGGFENCNCCGSPTGIIPTTASIIDGYSFSVNKLGGDVSGNFTNDGSNIVLNIGDVSYIVTMGLNSPSTVSAFSFDSTVAGDGFTKTYYLNIDGQQLGIDVLNNISNDSQALSIFNTLVGQYISTGGLQLIVDGDCIFQSTASCDYSYLLSNIPATTTFAILSSIKVGDIVNSINYPFNGTNLASLQSYLNGLGYGTFVVTDLGSGNVLIESNSNTNSLGNLTYKTASLNYIADFSKNCTGFAPLSANEVIQNIINYLCGLNDTQVVTSQEYVITYIDPLSNTIEQQTVASGVELNEFIIELLDRGVDTANYIISLSKLNCANVQNLFPVSASVMQSNDYLLGTKLGACARIYPVELATRQLQLGIYDPIFMEAFCTAVNLCNAGLICNSPTAYNLVVTQHSPADDLIDILVTYEYAGATNISGVNLRYARIDNTTTPSFTIVGFITLGSSPYTIADIDEGQYVVEIQPVYSDGRSCPYVSLNTPACIGITSFSAVKGDYDDNDTIDVTYTALGSVPTVQLTVIYPNGGIATVNYANGDDIHFILPETLFGVYSVTLAPVCNENTGWIGQATAPILVDFPFPPNSSIVNNTAGNLTSVFMSLGNGINTYNFGTLSASGGANSFYAPNGFFGTITITWNTGTAPVTASLLSDATTYNGVIGANSLTFSNVTIVSGATITLA